jgi:hypothetical protein
MSTPNGTDTSGSCATNTVSNAFPTIQDALACAVSGDAISLAPTGSTPYPGFGTVSEDVTIAARSGATARTVVVNETAAALTVDAGATVTLTGVTLNGGTSPDCAGPLADGPGGHNLIGDVGTGTGTGACSGLTNGDQISIPAGLLPLASNGGPTKTAALAPTSPAIGAGNATTCAQAPVNGTTCAQAPVNGKDQRGHGRNATTRGGCDIGAYDTGGAS